MNITYNKEGLVPVIIQDHINLQVLMLGYMNKEAMEKTLQEGRVTFYSRSKKRLWTKGETSGNFLAVKDIHIDCDNDSLLILAEPAGVVCHNGTRSCFAHTPVKGFLYQLENEIKKRIDEATPGSYTNELYKKGINKVAQKVGEEAVELIIEAKDNNESLFLNEGADLVYHFLVLLKTKNVTFGQVEQVLQQRAK